MQFQGLRGEGNLDVMLREHLENPAIEAVHTVLEIIVGVVA